MTTDTPVTDTPAVDEQANAKLPAPSAPLIGGWVQYQLSQADVDDIERRRKRSAAAPKNDWGFVAPRGNPVAEGDVVAALVVRVFGPSAVNLRVVLDGTDELWVTSRGPGDGPGHWVRFGGVV